jgi:hypothetical protein
MDGFVSLADSLDRGKNETLRIVEALKSALNKSQCGDPSFSVH